MLNLINMKELNPGVHVAQIWVLNMVLSLHKWSKCTVIASDMNYMAISNAIPIQRSHSDHVSSFGACVWTVHSSMIQ